MVVCTRFWLIATDTYDLNISKKEGEKTPETTYLSTKLAEAESGTFMSPCFAREVLIAGVIKMCGSEESSSLLFKERDARALVGQECNKGGRRSGLLTVYARDYYLQ
jgi:uncharacterized membrane protein